MSWLLLYHVGVAHDVTSAVNWYEEQREGLGDRFQLQIDEAFDRIAEFPEIYPELENGVRSCRVRRFPYLVYFRIVGNAVEVLAVVHGHRDVAAWRSRL